MRKWGLLLVAAGAVLVGCDGSSGSSGGVGGGGGGGGVVVSSINPAIFSNSSGAFGRIEVTYNTGQGRAPGSLTAVINRLSLVDDLFPIGDSRNNVDTLLNPERHLGLDAYTSQSISVGVPISLSAFSGPVNGRLFDSFTLDIAWFLEEQFNGSLSVVNGSGGPAFLQEVFDANLLALAGRTTSLQIFIDDAMITAPGSGISFDRDLFEAVNLVDDGNGNMVLLGHLADYVVFDITNVAGKPTMSNSVPATRVWFSGDAIALSGAVGPGAEYMEVLSPLPPPIEGIFNPPVPLPGGIGPGTYTLVQGDPVDISGLAKITALRGTWRNYSDTNTAQSAFLNLGTYECFTFPQSLDQDKHDMVVVARNGAGTITNLYFGQMNFGNNSFSIWPINQVDDGDASNELEGSISGLLDRNGSTAATNRHVRSGTFTITTPVPLPSGFAQTGRFIVYRL